MGLKDLIIYNYPIFRRDLFLSEKPYFQKREQRKGESDLVRLAETAKREYNWTFFKDTDYWIHLAGHHEEKLDPKTGGTAMFISKHIIEPSEVLGSDIAEYHLHPDFVIDYYFECKPEEQEALMTPACKSLLIFPSDRDLENTIKHPEREWKIATSLGTTTYRKNKKSNQSLFKAVEKEYFIYDLSYLEHFDGWLQDFIERVNKEMHGEVIIEFCPKSKL